MEKNETTTNNSLVPSPSQAIARRSDSLVMRGLRDLDAAEQEARGSLDIFERLDKIYLAYGRGTATDERLGIWTAGDSFTVFTGDSEPDGDTFTEFYVFDFCLLGNDDLDFWKEVGDPAALTQEKLRAALRKYRPKLRADEWPGAVREVRPPSESHIMVGVDLFVWKQEHTVPLGIAVWSVPTALEIDGSFVENTLELEVEIDGNFVGNTPLQLEIVTGEHSLVIRKAGYETWSRKLRVAVPEQWPR